MKIAILQFPGSNCERETSLAVKRANMNPVEILWNEPAAKILNCDGCIIAGGFSYEDRCRAGLIASLDPIINTLHQLNKQGKPILGICNGAQILVESGLVPGLEGNQIGMALTTNKRVKDNNVQGTGFYNAWIHIKKSSNNTDAFTTYLKNPIHIPAAHAEGRFVIPDDLMQEIGRKQIGVLQYCDSNGDINPEFPVNPNGSQYNLAAVCNHKGNIMAIMPHPERTTNGDPIFQSMREYIDKTHTSFSHPDEYTFKPTHKPLTTYSPPDNAIEIIVEQIITDNAAKSVQQALKNLGFDCKITRQIHWEIKHHTESRTLKQELINSYELFNPQKEVIVTDKNILTPRSLTLLVQDKEDLLGRRKLEVLKHKQEFATIKQITRGIIWNITSDNLGEITDFIINKHIVHNPYAHNCFFYPGE